MLPQRDGSPSIWHRFEQTPRAVDRDGNVTDADFTAAGLADYRRAVASWPTELRSFNAVNDRLSAYLMNSYGPAVKSMLSNCAAYMLAYNLSPSSDTFAMDQEVIRLFSVGTARTTLRQLTELMSNVQGGCSVG